MAGRRSGIATWLQGCELSPALHAMSSLSRLRAEPPAGPVTAALAAYITALGRRKCRKSISSSGGSTFSIRSPPIVACRDLEPSKLARKYVAAQGSRGAATILGTREKAGLIDAAFASAMTAHAAEINDFIPSAFVQPGPAIVGSALAVAETRNLSGDALLRAVVVGYELAGRVPEGGGRQQSS